MSDARTVTSSASPSLSQFAEDVRYYLSLHPRQLPSKYLYDSLGSALFDAITQLPWYSLTRAEVRLLETHAADIFSALDQLETVLELGPGSGDKLLTLIRARAAYGEPFDVRLIDVSPSALARAARTLGVTSGISVTTYEDAYEAGLERFRTERRGGGHTLALFLGSNIGNFDRPGCEAFLRTLRAALLPCDALLLGADLVKSERELVLAYDDPLGVTAAFNRNLLVRINRELGADFDVDGFAHRAVWNAGQSRVEMHLVSRRPHVTRIPAADLALRMREGETIWTESSYKYRPADVTALLDRNGFRTIAQWVDTTEPFALTLAEAR
jgi:dimethylhistidine N-methyltransferase